MPIEKGCTHCGSDQHNTTECPMRDAAPAGEREAYDHWKADMEPYGFGGLDAFQAGATWQRTQSAGVPDVSAMARVLSDRSADACNIDRTDNWAMYGQEYIEDVQAMLAARAQPAAQDQGEVQRLQIALRLSANRFDRLALEFPDASDMRWTASEWANEARSAIAASTGQEVDGGN